MPKNQAITPCFWFDRQAEEAVNAYVAIFPNSSIGAISRYGEAGKDVHHMPAGTVLTIAFELNGQGFTALNGGPVFNFSPATSFIVHCDTQAEVDHYWEKLGAGGDPAAQQCGWLKDRYGLSWQVVPRALPALLMDPDPAKAGRVMTTMMKMKKIDIAELERAKSG